MTSAGEAERSPSRSQLADVRVQALGTLAALARTAVTHATGQRGTKDERFVWTARCLVTHVHILAAAVGLQRTATAGAGAGAGAGAEPRSPAAFPLPVSVRAAALSAIAEVATVPGAVESSSRIALASAGEDAGATVGTAWAGRLLLKVPQVVTPPAKSSVGDDGAEVAPTTNALKLVPKLSCWPAGPEGSQLVVPGSPVPLPASFDAVSEDSHPGYLGAVFALVLPLVSVVSLQAPCASEGMCRKIAV